MEYSEEQLVNESDKFESTYDKEQFKLWKSSVMTHPLAKDILNGTSNVSYYDILNHCNNTALVGYRGHLLPLYNMLLESHNKERVFRGKEFIFQRHYGLNLHRYGSTHVLKRFWALFESGVYGLLTNTNKQQEVEVVKNYIPQAVSIKGNILIQFKVLASGLSLALMSLVVEYRVMHGRRGISYLILLGKIACNTRRTTNRLIINIMRYVGNNNNNSSCIKIHVLSEVMSDLT